MVRVWKKWRKFAWGMTDTLYLVSLGLCLYVSMLLVRSDMLLHGFYALFLVFAIGYVYDFARKMEARNG